jgi:DNA-binding beta-propeller fold protein YncE
MNEAHGLNAGIGAVGRELLLAAVGALSLTAMACGGSEAPSEPTDGRAGAEQVGESQEGLTCINIRRGATGNVTDATITTDPTNPTSGNQNSGSSINSSTGDLGTATRQSLLGFDLSPIPANVAIISATLTLRKQLSVGNGIVNVHKATAGWSEATVTWNNFLGAFDPAVLATIDTGAVANGGAAAVDLKTLVKGWHNGSIANQGILLEQPGPARAAFGASEAPANLRPILAVCYGPINCGNNVQESNELGVDCGGPCGPCQGNLIAVQGAGGVSGSLWSVDVSNGALTALGATPAMTGLAAAPSGAVYGTTATEYNAGSLLAVDPSTGNTRLIGQTSDGSGTNHGAMPDLTFVGNTLYAWTEDSDDLATIDPSTGFVTVVGDAIHGTFGSGLAASPSGVVWMAGDGGYNGSTLYTMNLSTGQALATKALGGTQYDVIRGMTFMNGTLWAVGSDWGNVTDLITININTGQIQTVAALPAGTESLIAAPPAGTCADGVYNNGETNVDCGGPNCATCVTCTDGVQNQGETGVDCGGPCLPCGAPLLLLATGTAAQAGSMYIVDANTAQHILLGPIGPGVTGMATAPDGNVYATTSTSWNFPAELIQIDPTTGAGTTIGPVVDHLGSNHQAIPDLTFSGTTLYGWSESNDELISIDTASGAVTLLPTYVGSYGSGIAADANGTMYLAPDSVSGFLYTVDANGNSVNLGQLDGPNYDVVRGMTFLNGTLYAVTSDYGGVNLLVSIDPATLHVTAIGPVPAGVEAISVKP